MYVLVEFEVKVTDIKSLVYFHRMIWWQPCWKATECPSAHFPIQHKRQHNKKLLNVFFSVFFFVGGGGGGG